MYFDNPKLAKRRVVVVGGGVVGCAVAFELCRAKMNVVLIERDDIAAHASGQNAGNLNPLHGSSPDLLPVALEAFRIHQEVRAALSQLGCDDFACAPVERLLLGFEEAERSALEKAMTLFQSTPGFSGRWLEGEAIRMREPRIAGDVAFGVATSGSLSLDGAAFTRALASAAIRLGAEIRRGAVTGIEVRGDRAVGVRLGEETIELDELVLATGPWVAETMAWLGIETSVRPVKGEMLLVRHPDGPLRCDLTWGDVALYARRGMQTWIGGTMTDSGFDAAPTQKVGESLLERSAHILPTITKAQRLDHVAALRPVASPNTPIARRDAPWRNVLSGNGAGAKGMLLSVSVARALRDLLWDGAEPHSLAG